MTCRVRIGSLNHSDVSPPPSLPEAALVAAAAKIGAFKRFAAVPELGRGGTATNGFRPCNKGDAAGGGGGGAKPFAPERHVHEYTVRSDAELDAKVAHRTVP